MAKCNMQVTYEIQLISFLNWLTVMLINTISCTHRWVCFSSALLKTLLWDMDGPLCYKTEMRLWPIFLFRNMANNTDCVHETTGLPYEIYKMGHKAQRLTILMSSTDLQMSYWANNTGIILAMDWTNERRHYFVTSSLIGWAHTQNHPCNNPW